MEKRKNKLCHQLPTDEVVQFLGVNLSTGLMPEEVRRRQKEFGPNRVTARRGTPAWLKFLRQLNQPLVYILLVAAGVTAFLGEWVDSSVIFGVVIINAIVGFLQEAKAEKAIEALARMVATETNVRRDGRRLRVHSQQLVPGDIVLLQSGDRVPADLRLFHVRDLHADESALTGESLPVAKHANALALDTILAERKNIAYTGTLITSGQAEGVVWAIGDQTETGRISHLISSAVELATPLTRKIAQFSRLVLWVIVALAAATFALGVARGAWREGRRDVHGGGGARSRGDSRRSSCGCHHRARHRSFAHGEAAGHHPQIARRRDPRQHHCHLLGQDRHAH